MEVKFQNNILLKLLAVGFLMLLFMIPTGMISGLINERQWTSEEAATEVSSKWGNAQTIVGPVLTIPYKKIVETEDKKITEIIKYAHFLPKVLNIDGNIQSEMLSRGIYDVVVYGADLNFSGNFSQPNFNELKIEDKDILWQDAVLSVGIPDVRGIKENILFNWNGDKMAAKPGIGTNLYLGTDSFDNFNPRKPETVESNMGSTVDSGIHSKVNIKREEVKDYSFDFKLNINGSRDISFVPVGMENNIELKSPWTSPSFTGAFLPDEREINDNGFSSKWKILEYNRSLPQSWLGESIQNFSESKFGVNLFLGVDQYQKNTRSIKYAIMLIALTFLIFFFIEAINRIRVHPVQYILVGLAIVLFFTLLLSLSEHLSFNNSYLISALVTISMITIYSKHILNSRKLSLVQGGILLLVYLFVFTIIQLEDYALLVGSIGLFVILAIVMYISRKINWYEINN